MVEQSKRVLPKYFRARPTLQHLIEDHGYPPPQQDTVIGREPQRLHRHLHSKRDPHAEPHVHELFSRRKRNRRT